MDVDMTVEERLLTSEVGDRLLAGEPALPGRTMLGELRGELVEQIEVSLDLRPNPFRITGVVMLEHLKERMVVESRPRRARLRDRDLFGRYDLDVAFRKRHL